MPLFADSIIVPVLIAGPLLAVCSWLLWGALGRPGFRARKLGGPREWHPLVVILGVLLLVFVAGAVLLELGQAWYIRDINKSNARHQVLREAFMLLDQYEEANGRPATTVDDLFPFAAEWPNGFAAIQSGKVVVLWGRSVRVSRTEPVVVAHETLDGRRRILVLYSDGHSSGESSEAVAGLIAK